MIFSLITTLLVAANGTAQERNMPPVEAFVKARNFHGMRYDLAKRYGAEDVAQLAELLKDEDANPYWANAVWLLGIIGTAEAEEAIIDFRENRFKGTVEGPVLQALLMVSQALGFRANDSDSKAFRYLVDSTNLQALRERNLKWTGAGWEDGSRELLLAKLSVNGLGLAGNAAGRDHLERLARSLPDTNAELWRVLKPNVTEALELSRRIEQDGYEQVLAPQGVLQPRPRPRSKE
ncbi:MAG: hypothetical protein ETSY1_15695 [Candidatus Entotheonella factor]|uniref:HEAT repeat domain-containing protein n=1 Tax=Entotheonella factor TaxID=1429438 RepID=W4LMW2_ENTF1|nr:hypothetical protein [Candidatus Entotheonella palauensis]ETW99244.1 MAG: hypothetical protein ETSY1_15695 [Candidatus Entotheonella factor]